MRVATDVLQRFIQVGSERAALRELLDDTGLEVKRVDNDGVADVFTLELLANRGDHRCYEGIARELDGRLGVGTRAPQGVRLDVGPSPWPLRCASALCSTYTATLLELPSAEAQGTLSDRALRVLAAAGIHSLGPAVDATNVANLELGQPTHAFDADTLVGTVHIRQSQKGETAHPLFADGRVELPEGTLVIADDEKILAIAGVIGCEESKATEGTTRLLLESATFDPVAVRKASRALNIHTDSSARFERGSDPERALWGAGRVVELLESAGWARVGTTGMVGEGPPATGRVVALSAAAAGRFLDVPLQPAEIAGRLQRYGFEVRTDPDDADRLLCTVPSWRIHDVEFPADLYEELAKSIGYNATPQGLPPVELGALPSPREQRRERVEEVLLGMGFYEVFTDGFYGRDTLDLLGVEEDHPLHHHVQTLNALDRAYSMLKNNCLAQAVAAVAVNERRRVLDLKLYEWTRTFHPIDEVLPAQADPERPPCRERAVLWAVASGHDRQPTWAGEARQVDPLFFKGLVEELAVELGLDLLVRGADADHPLASSLHPNRQGAILLDGEVVGIVGEVHPDVRDRAKLKHSAPIYLEIEAAALLAPGSRPAFVEPSAFHPVVRSLAFTLPHRMEAGAVRSWLHASGPDDLAAVTVTDVYPHGDGRRTITYELTFRHEGEQVSSDEVNAAVEALVASVEEQFGDAGVSLR